MSIRDLQIPHFRTELYINKEIKLLVERCHGVLNGRNRKRDAPQFLTGLKHGDALTLGHITQSGLLL